MTKHYSLRFLWCLLLLTASTIAPIHAQTNGIVWQRTIENYLDQVKMATTSDGSVGLIVTGTRPGKPIELTKLDPSGNVAWKRPILGTRIGVPAANPPFFNLEVLELYLIEGTRDGGFVVVLQQRLTNDLLYMITKFDSAGNQLWMESVDSYSLGSNLSLLPVSLSETSDGGFIISMGVSQTRFGPFVRLYKHNSSGRQGWIQNYASRISVAGSRFGFLTSNELTERTGGYAFTGISSEVLSNGQTVSEPVLILIDGAGVETARKAYTSEFSFTDIDYNSETNSFIVVSNNAQGRGVLKLNGQGDVQFRTIIPRRAGESRAYVAVAHNPQDGYIVADTDPINEADFRLTRINRDGSPQPSQTFGGRQADYLQAFDIQPNGNLVMAGVTQSIDRDLAARQSISLRSSAPVAWVLSVNNGTTPPVTPPTPPTTPSPSGFALTSPAYDCNTGQLTLNTSGGNGSAIEYRIIGNRDWSASNVFSIPAHQRVGTTFTLDARQNGQVVSLGFTAACGTVPPTPPTPPTPPVGTNLSFGGWLLNCNTGELNITATGGDRTLIEYKIPGLADWQLSNTFTIPTYQRNNTSFTVYLRQSGRETQGTFTAPCRTARVASPELTTQLNAVVLPNPVVGSELTVEVTGATGQIVHFALTDLGGRTLTTQQAEVATNQHRQTMAVGHLLEGIYLLRVSTPTQTKTVKVMKQ